MNCFDQIEIFRKEIDDLKNQMSKKTEQLISWARDNKTEIKKYFPKKGKIYEITDPIAFAWEKNENTFFYCNTYFSHKEKFYLKVTNSMFIPSRDFDIHRGIKMPTVKGIILNSDLDKPCFYHSENEIEITYLKEVGDDVLSDKPTNVYVMIDKNTGYYKIGKSVKPKFRERTLQSEKPTIEMLFTHEGRCSDEKALHEIFKEKRIRGEWFDLSGSDLTIIHSYFNNKKDVTPITSCNF